MFTVYELKFLRANELPEQRWRLNNDARPFIKALVRRGLMQIADGEFGQSLNSEGWIKISFRGIRIPVVELVSLYQLTTLGKSFYPVNMS